MRKTKIICTIGPASENEETLTQMCLAGMNVARLNFSHGTHAEHERKIELVKRVRQKLGLPIAIMLDTKGPEYRIGTFASGKVEVKTGDSFTFTTQDVAGDETKVSVNYKNLHKDLKPGNTVTVNNGIVRFEVESIEGTEIHCKCLAGGTLSDRKSMSFPNKVMSGPYISQQDRSDILFGIAHGVDYVAASFVSTKQDVLDIRKLLDENGGSDIEIVAKIENRSGVDNVEEICSVCGGIMIARGDLGVEIPYVEVPSVQKKLTRMCRMLGKRVITATEMLESMIQNPRPTRAEITDVANAVYDGTSCVMLSGESAAVTFFADGIDLIDKDDTRCFLVCLLEQVTHLCSSHADEHLDELGAGNGEERNICLSGYCLCKQRFTGSRRADKQCSFRHFCTNFFIFFWIMQEINNLL